MNENSEVNRDQLVADMKTVLSSAEELWQATASSAGEKASAARRKMADSLDAAKARLASAEEVVVDHAKAAATATDDYVHANPWKAIGYGAAIGILVGVLVMRR